MKKTIWSGLMAVSLCGLLGAECAEAQQVDHYTTAALMQQASALKEKAAAAKGAAAETLQKYGVDFTMLSVRTQSGTAELHEKFADIFVVIDGAATLLSGGELDHPTTLSPGELHGTAILHSATTHLGKGDVVHIPPNTPHQLLLPAGGTLVYFVIKVKEKD
jgi:mannose-6-phosphate isomerase-like protein (cupin superfamily)